MRAVAILAVCSVLTLALSLGCGGRRRGGGGGPPPPPSDAGGRDTGGGDCTTDGCPTGFTCNTGTGVCEPDTTDCTVTGCPAGQTCNMATGACEPDTPTDCTVDGCPVGQVCNSSSGDCQTASCTSDFVDRIFGACDAATVACITSGGDITTCVDSDSDPTGCNGCINQNLFNCANAMGCQTDWNQLACCRDAFCGGPPIDDACIEGPCSIQWTTYTDCIGTLGMGVCATAVTDCDAGF